MRLIRSIYDVILDRNPEEILGAFGIAVALSIALSGVFALLRRKAEDRVLLVIVLMIVASVASMGLGAGYVTSPRNRNLRPGPGGNEGLSGRMGYRVGVSPRAIRKADADGDGRISTAEASEAAGRYVAGLDAEHGSSVDFATLFEAMTQAGEDHPMVPPAFSEPTRGLDARAAAGLASSSDGDGNRRLTVAEASSFLRTADADGDGGLSPAEMRRAIQALATSPDNQGERRERMRHGMPSPETEILRESPTAPTPAPSAGPAEPASEPGAGPATRPVAGPTQAVRE